MKCISVDLAQTGKFSNLFLDYLKERPELKKFYNTFPKVENFAELIQKRNFSAESRKILCQVLNAQYQHLHKHDALNQNLQLLSDERTFTITTGHQLNIFTGPLYFIYKIVSVINTCKTLKVQYPDYNFVPVYWMASEDHDYDEINYFRLEGKKYKWETKQSGAVGHFEPLALANLAKEIPGMPSFFVEAYANANTLADAVLHYVNALFGEEGLVVVDADQHDFKSLFANVIQDDLTNHTAKGLVENASEALDKLGYKTQVFPREINFFYLDKNLRSRIEIQNGNYKVLDTELEFTPDEMDAILANEPEKFSPNVILRPLYQETLLPNLAYIGGPAEVAYWFQLKPVFDYFKVAFPALMPRNFAMIVPPHILSKIEKLGLSCEELFKSSPDLHKNVVVNDAGHKVLLNGQKEEFMLLFEKIKQQAATIDPTLVAHVDAQGTRTLSKLEAIEKKFIRAEKRRNSEKIGQLDAVLDYLFPNGGLQERSDNFLNFYRGDQQFVKKLIAQFDPFDFRFHILTNV